MKLNFTGILNDQGLVRGDAETRTLEYKAHGKPSITTTYLRVLDSGPSVRPVGHFR